MSARAGFVAAWSLTIGCVLPSFEKVEGGGAGGGGSPPIGGGGSGGASCESATISPAPASAPPGGEVDFVTAIRTVDLGEAHLADRPGFDLDGACTCCAGCPIVPTCMPPTNASTEPCDEVDGQANAGRDNNAAKLFSTFDANIGNWISSPTHTSHANAGTWSLLARVFHYNAAEDDAQVSVAIYGTMGVETTPPKWDGTDKWTVREDSLLTDYMTIDDAKVLATDAYVAGNVVVAQFTTPIALRLDYGLVVTLDNALFQATIAKTPSGDYRLLDGTIGGSWRSNSVFAAFGAMRAADMPIICQGTAGYDMFFKGPLCRSRDSSKAMALSQCDSLSFGIGFTADPVDPLPSIAIDTSMSMACGLLGEPSDDSCP